MPELAAEVPERALAVYAHPDDAEVSCGATLARWAAGGSEVHVLVCARGEKGSSDPGADTADLARRRAAEMAEAGEVLGLAGRHELGLDDGELGAAPGLPRRIVAVVRLVRPDVVLCPDPTAVFFGDTYYNHADHRSTGWATLDAVAPAAANPHYFPDAGPAHRVAQVLLSGTLAPNVWVDVASSLDVKIAAVLCHRSQLAGLEPDRAPPAAGSGHAGGSGDWLGAALRQRAADEGRAAGVAYAEGFRRLFL